MLPPEWARQPIPARMLGSDVPVPVAPSLLRVRNGWLVSDGRTLVAVYAGAAGDDPSVGRLVVVRQDLAAGRQTVRTIDAGATGALTIAVAPLGSSVETSAQTDPFTCAPPAAACSASTSARGRSAADDPSVLTRPSRIASTVTTYGRLVRVTQLRTRFADSTVATAVMRLLSNRKIQLVLNGGFGLVLLAVAWVSIRHFVGGGWPIHHADPLLVSCAALLFLCAYAFKAWGWQRLFQASERPTADALAFAGGAACVGGIALPGRVDDAVRIAIVRRYPGTKTGIGTLGLSAIVLGMLDNAAFTPMASVVAAGSTALDDPRRLRRGCRRRKSPQPWSSPSCPASPAFRSSPPPRRPLARRAHALHEGGMGGVAVHLGLVEPPRPSVLLLLNALSMPGSYVLALAFLVAPATSAALPIAPAGARPRRARAPRSSCSAASARRTPSRSRWPRRRSSS